MKNEAIKNHLSLTVKASTLSVYTQVYRTFGRDLVTVTSPELWNYVERLRAGSNVKGERLSWRTVKKHLSAISAGIEAAIRLGLREENPAPRVIKSLRYKKTPKRFETFALTKREVNRVLEVSRTVQQRALVSLLFYSGLRISEALNLNLNDVLANEQRIYLRDTKNNEAARPNVSRHAMPWLVKLVSQRSRTGAKGADPLFVGELGERLNRRVAYSIFKRLCELAGLGKRGTHTGRKTAITQLLADGTPFNQVRNFSRHSTVAMVENYEDKRISVDAAIEPVY